MFWFKVLCADGSHEVVEASNSREASKKVTQDAGKAVHGIVHLAHKPVKEAIE
jgi:hypothetical protein